MVMDWDARVAKARSWVRRHSSLRGLPLIITETNHNLINHNPADRSNLKPSITSASAQAQLAAATVMNASFRGVRDLYWLSAPPGQAAVNLAPGTPAQAAMLALSTATQGMRLTGCRWYGSLRGCNYQDPTGVRPASASCGGSTGPRGTGSRAARRSPPCGAPPRARRPGPGSRSGPPH